MRFAKLCILFLFPFTPYNNVRILLFADKGLTLSGWHRKSSSLSSLSVLRREENTIIKMTKIKTLTPSQTLDLSGNLNKSELTIRLLEKSPKLLTYFSFRLSRRGLYGPGSRSCRAASPWASSPLRPASRCCPLSSWTWRYPSRTDCPPVQKTTCAAPPRHCGDREQRK